MRAVDPGRFRFQPSLATDRAGHETTYKARLVAAAGRAMEEEGYVYSETDGRIPVNFHCRYRRGQHIRWGTPKITTVDREQGTLTIDNVHAKEEVPAPPATAIGRMSKAARGNPTSAFPPRAG